MTNKTDEVGSHHSQEVRPRSESRRPTIADLLILVAGVAIVLSSPDLPFGIVKIEHINYGSLVVNLGGFHWSVLWTVGCVAFPLGFVIALAILVRRLRFGGMPRSAEWPILVLAAAAVSRSCHLGPDWPRPDSEYSGWTAEWWTHADVACSSVLAGLLVLAISPRSSRPWARTLFLGALALTLLFFPLRTLRDEYARPPRVPMSLALAGSPRPSYTELVDEEPPPSWSGSLLWHARIAAALIPEGIFFGVPSVAALASWTRRRPSGRIWTEWIGLGLVGGLAMCWLLDGVVIVGNPEDPNRFPNLVVRGLWLVAVVGISVLIVRGLGRAWDAWFDLDRIPPRTSPSTEDEP